jgi:tetratricopeptide (TPR) repeat protein
MAKTKTKSHSKQKDILHSTNTPLVKSSAKKSQQSIEDLLSKAAELLEQSQPELALPLAEEALRRLEAERQTTDENVVDIDTLLQAAAEGKSTLPTALTLEAEVQLALGDADSARRSFARATQIDPDGALVSAEPWLWLAQLCEEGGRESISYFERATEVLRNEIEVLEEEGRDENARVVLDEKKAKLADALCAMAEVYMTDLSWEDDAERRCEAYVTEAVAVCPERLSAGVLQTLANVRISQTRIDDAKQALRQSMEIWRAPVGADDDDAVATAAALAARPDFPARISLSRLLMEVEVEEEAMTVLEGLVREDDQSVEAWYLGGWCQVLISEKAEKDLETRAKSRETAKTWLDTCLRLYRVQDYEDDKLRDHALELARQLNKTLGVEDQMEDDDNAWEDEDEDEEDGDVELELNGHDHAGDDDVEMS